MSDLGEGETLILGKLTEFILSVSCPILDIEKDLLYTALYRGSSQEYLNMFATESSRKVLVIQKSEEEILVSLEVEHKGPTYAILAFIKREGQGSLEEKQLGAQLQIVNLSYISPDSTPFELMHTYLQNSFLPLFNTYKGQNLASEEDSKMDSKLGLTTVQKKISETMLALMQYQQDVEIPEVILQIDPYVRERFTKAKLINSRLGIELFDDKLQDKEYLSGLTACVDKWIHEIRKVTRLSTKDHLAPSILHEVNFWECLTRALNHIDNQLKLPEVTITLDILKQAKRIHTMMSFNTDTGLDHALQVCQTSNILMKDFPANRLLSSDSIESVSDAIIQIFQHMKKLKHNDSYPLLKAQQIVDLVSKDVSNQLLKILHKERLMTLDWEEFDKAMKSTGGVFSVWDAQYKAFKEIIRLQAKRKGGIERLLPKKDFEHSALQNRIGELHQFKSSHERLKEVISSVFNEERQQGEIMALREINLAYAHFTTFDILDLSKEGSDMWEMARKQYEQKIDRVESQITAKLRDRLGIAKSANEMFRVFGKFNALFIRPRIKSAIQEYQTQLISQVRSDIQLLQDKFKKHYSNTEAALVSKVRDFPEVSGAIIWAKQIERKLKIYMERVEAVLGKDWKQHPEGKKLFEIGEAFAKKLDTKEAVDKWIEEMLVYCGTFDFTDKIFEVVSRRDLHGKEYWELTVNFDEQVITLFKEVRALNWLKFKGLIAMKIKADDIKTYYPYATSLQEALRTYQQTCAKIDHKIEKLLAENKSEIQKIFIEGTSLMWNSEARLDTYVKKLMDKVIRFEEKVIEVLDRHTHIQNEIESLQLCSVTKENFTEHMNKIQRIIDDLSLNDFSNLELWVEGLDKNIEIVLKTRLGELIKHWIREFQQWDELKKDAVYINCNTVHEVKLKDQTLFLDPPLEEARAFWTTLFHRQLHIICGQSRIEATQYDVLKQYTKRDYTNLLPEIMADVVQAYKILDEVLGHCEEYVKTWLGYQALWDTQASDVYNELGDNIEMWQQLLEEIKQNRITFDNSETEIHFGAIVIDYKAVQSKVNHKYDQWHRDILNKFGTKLGDTMRTFNISINSARMQLEKQSLESSSSDVTVFVTEIQELKKNMEAWDSDMNKYRTGQRLLERQRFHFPADWLWIDQLEGDWSSFRQILTRKSQTMESEIPILQAKIKTEEKVLMDKIKEIEDSWKNNKPFSGEQSPAQALEALSLTETKVKRASEQYNKICKAKEVLDMEPSDPDRLNPLTEEIQGLKEVWSELAKIWANIENLRDTPWSAIVTKKIKDVIDKSVEEMNKLPSRLRQYEAFDTMKSKLSKLSKSNKMISELKSEALKERHWKQLNQRLKLKKGGINDMTLGNIWDADPLKHEKFINEVLSQAAGELALEEFLKGVREYWLNFLLDLVNYQNKCRLIRGWDDLFGKLDEHINSLNSMKMSPHYKVFEEEVQPWDEKLQKIRVVFDIWIDVQRRWVYLEGIFFGSADIKQQLPSEFSKFKSIDSEFTSLMRKVSSKPLVLDVLALPGIQKTLERLSELLAKIQKALGDYLETQRQAFARFYFVGDEDLLEIIGNSKDVTNVQRHFSKMFAGICSLGTSEPDVLISMMSREDEKVDYPRPVKISEDSAIHAWLTKVEVQMRESLAFNLEQCVNRIAANENFLNCAKEFPAQIMLLGSQVDWSHRIEVNIPIRSLNVVEEHVVNMLMILAQEVLENLPAQIRKKYEQLITDLVHQRDVTRYLMNKNISSNKDFEWLIHMRFYWHPKEADPMKKLNIEMSNAHFYYGFEYLGVGDKLVQTPLTDRCYLTLTQALHMRLGGNPFGPAGTGKTESVKALGSQLGTFVLVFNCDETFDFQAMGRIFVGLCQVGAWGCFDEFNRLEERMLSAVSQQILVIQTGLMDHLTKIELLGKEVKLKQEVGIFVTMNPGYAGRSNLPDNLKQLFRQIAMVKPDKELIAQVMLYSQGFKTAERLSGKIVSLFDLCNDQLSNQPHYDFGLRALKSVLVTAGNIKRGETQEDRNLDDWEQNILLRSVCDTVVPKLIAEDVPLLSSLLSGVIPGADIIQIGEENLREALKSLCKKHNLLPEPAFIEKVLQLNQILRIHHGVMMVGPSGSGKSAAWRLLLEALGSTDNKKGESYIIDPKAIIKDDLYGKLDATTLEWTDGVFTHVLRKILDNVRGEVNKRHWIIFDGDVDPEWAENLNSVLDDNKLLTLPNGERLLIPTNVKIMFEVETLKHATLATVSRCGMVWFSAETVSKEMVYYHYLSRLQQENFDDLIVDEEKITPQSPIRKECVGCIKKFFSGEDCFVSRMLNYAESKVHIMDFTRIRVLDASFALIRKGISNVLDYNEGHPDFPLSSSQIEEYMTKWLSLALMWGVGGSLNLREREKFSVYIMEQSDSNMPPSSGAPLLDYEVRIEDQSWSLWKKKVPNIEIETHRVIDADVVITTIDTLRHQEVLCSWLSEHRPFLLCGPPGSGKTMTLMATLKALPDFEMIFVNFSSSTTPSLILKTFDHYCEYSRTPNGIVLRPHQPNKWLVVFCDEINLPDEDKYGTQSIITFLRQLTEQNGFWRPHDKQWVTLERMQFVGACNPPTDAGRHPLSPRFLRHTPLIFVDFPGRESLLQIYGTFNRAMLKRVPSLRAHAGSLTEAMVEFYMRSQETFTADIQPHYIYSPRELTRWKYAIFEALDPIDSLEDLVRLFVHEGLRLFQDRMVLPSEKEWCDKNLDDVATQFFPMVKTECLQRPMLFSSYLTKNYISVEREELRKHILARLKTFYEEELDVPLVVFDSVLDHLCRIDRVLRQPLGHLLLVGASGTGKTTLSRFVSWMNNLSVFQIKAGRNYSVEDFDDDLRTVMKRSGCKGERICFIFDESNVLSTAFLERMNALLASGEVPGLFDGEEYMSLMNQCKESAQREGKIMDTEEELYRNFIYNVQRNLHVVFTMNPANPDFSNRTASSPALFNRCVIDWFGNWPEEALYQVANEFTHNMDLLPNSFSHSAQQDDPDLRHEAIVNAIVNIHNSVVSTNSKLAKSAKKHNYITPRDFLDFIKHFVNLYGEKKSELEEQQLHLNIGLDKIHDTEEEVKKLQGSLSEKSKELFAKEKQANEKLVLMVSEQQQAEQKRESALTMTKELQVKDKEVKERQGIVNSDLAQAEPALIEAQEAVKSIQKKFLDELRMMASPPALVKMTLEAVLCLITNSAKPLDWAEIKTGMRKDDFISSIINFKTENLNPNVSRKIESNFLRSKDWNLDNIFRASKAAGPMAKWVDSQVHYAYILDRVEPLRNEVKELERQGDELKKTYKQLIDTIEELEKNIEKYKADYAALIAEVQRIKSEMQTVQDKVARSKALISNLASERERWEATSLAFQAQMSTMIGDVLLSGSFLAYIGFFDHFYRHSLMIAWKDFVDAQGIKFRQDMSLVEFLSKPSERLLWKAHYLPNDDLCIENAIILQRFNRYPLIIDPSGQAIEFLVAHYLEKKIIKISFADDAFMKNLESSLRFGCPILVEDVEKIDPVLNSVLNKEIYKTGGRVLIRVGDLEIDFSQNFNMFMVTRDTNANFTPDLCSRVTFVNFTVTMSSLQNQCLNIYLKNERPDVDQKRNDLLKLQGEYKVRIRELEEKLLQALNDVRGNILDDDHVMSTLENLKKEAEIVSKEAAQTEFIMQEVDQVSAQYLNLAVASSRIYFAMESLSTIHFLYHLSLNFFMNIIFDVLNKDQELLKISKSEYDQRLKLITHKIFVKVYRNVSRGLLESDKLVFALRLLKIRLGNGCEEELELLLRGSSLLSESSTQTFLEGRISGRQAKEIVTLSQTEIFNELPRHLIQYKSTWIEFLDSPQPEEKIPEGWAKINPRYDSFHSEVAKIVLEMKLLLLLRPDRFLLKANKLISFVLGDDLLASNVVDLGKVVLEESSPKSPLLLCSAPGFDPSQKVDKLVKDLNKRCTSVAIGSAEGFEIAEKAINTASKAGTWVLLKNVHLAPQWLVELEKKIHRLQPNENFRLFLTMEIHPRVPSTLVRISNTFVFEPPAGIKASLIRSFKTVLSQEKTDRSPAERSRLHFLLSWFHAVLGERLRYTPIGWTKVYEFGEADQRCTLDSIDQWIDSISQNRSNLPPEKIPWDAIRATISNSLYGGRVDNEYDDKILSSFVNELFREESFSSDFKLVDGKNSLVIPDARNYEQFLNWVNDLPSVEDPEWAGLPSNVEKLLKSIDANNVLSRLVAITGTADEELAYSEKTQEETKSAWLVSLSQRVTKLIEILPGELPYLHRTAQSITNPLFRFLEREMQIANKLLKVVRNDLMQLKEMIAGTVKFTNSIRQIAQDLHTDTVPKSWKLYPIAPVTVAEWLLDFKARLNQLTTLTEETTKSPSNFGKKGVWLGGFFFPEAFMTATRQATSQRHKWSLDELTLEIKIGSQADEDSFVVNGLRIEGASWTKDELEFTDELSIDLALTTIKWIKGEVTGNNLIKLPVYLNSLRNKLLFSVKILGGKHKPNTWYQRGVAITSWNKI
jgi:dynein heavy chain 1, cytosolic